MIISRGRRYIFVHIPKTGGTALTLALEARAMADDILIGDTPKARARRGRLKAVRSAGRLWKHSTLADIDGLLTGEIADFFTSDAGAQPVGPDGQLLPLAARAVLCPSGGGAGQGAFSDFAGFMAHPQTDRRASGWNWPYGAYMRDAGGPMERSARRIGFIARAEALEEPPTFAPPFWGKRRSSGSA
jgi:hypothetical protein